MSLAFAHGAGLGVGVGVVAGVGAGAGEGPAGAGSVAGGRGPASTDSGVVGAGVIPGVVGATVGPVGVSGAGVLVGVRVGLVVCGAGGALPSSNGGVRGKTEPSGNQLRRCLAGKPVTADVAGVPSGNQEDDAVEVDAGSSAAPSWRSATALGAAAAEETGETTIAWPQDGQQKECAIGAKRYV